MNSLKTIATLTLLSTVVTFPLVAGQFEIIDGTAKIAGAPDSMRDGARDKWQKACDSWKQETKDLNKSNYIIALQCNVPDCTSQDNGTLMCQSEATYKIKTDGQLVPAAPSAPPQAPEVIQAAPPPVIVEAAPPPNPGYIWVVGYWGWEGRRHLWYPGRWIHERPGYIWVNHSWARRGPGWHSEPGHWNHHPIGRR